MQAFQDNANVAKRCVAEQENDSVGMDIPVYDAIPKETVITCDKDHLKWTLALPSHQWMNSGWL